MHHRKYSIVIPLLALVAFILVSCTGNDHPADTSTGDSSFDRPSESATAPLTEAETEIPLPELAASAPTISSGFTVSENYHIPPTELSDKVTANVGGSNITLDASSVFYGTESAIDRDTFHWGNIFRYNDLRTSFDKPFVIGDLNGDRRGELLTFENGTLTAHELPERGKPKEVFSQKTGFDGILIGAGTLNDDYYTDLLFYVPSCNRLVRALGSTSGFDYAYLSPIPDMPTIPETATLFLGDFDADHTDELIMVNGLTVQTYEVTDTQVVAVATTTLPFATEGQFLFYAVADINSDGADDVIGFMKDPAGSKSEAGYDNYGTRSYMSRRDGQFGTYPSESDNKNINVEHIHIDAILPLFGAGGDVTGDGVDDLLIMGKNQSNNRENLYSLVYPSEAPAYDYSSHIIKTADGYILYTGGLYIDYNTDQYKETPADHIMAYTSKDGLTWHRNLDAACFFLGNELGVAGDYKPGDVFTEKWWMGNTMEPEVLYVDGTYYMYYQCENYRLDKNGDLMGADRIGVATSKDGIHFERKTDKPVIVTSDEYACFTHEEVIYVPDDPDGKCFWMYVRYVHNNVTVKRIRIRTADPTCFNMDEDYTECTGLGHIGNSIGYINNYDGHGNRLFVRINMSTLAFKGDSARERWVPTLQLSLDGIHWFDSGIEIASANLDIPEEANRHNICFMGISTINGTGEIAKTADGTGYEFFFIGCTTSSAVAPGIFYSSEGLGKVTFTVRAES